MIQRARFAVYMTAISAASIGLIALAAGQTVAFTDALVPWFAFVGLFVLAEGVVLFFHRTDARVGLSLSEAIVLVMLVALPWGQVVLALAAGAGLVTIAHRRIGVVKNVFNVASLTVAGAVAAGVAGAIDSGAPGDLLVRLGAAAVGTVVYAAITHLNVATAVSLSGEEKLLPLIADVPKPTLLNVAAGVLLGLHFAAAYSATPWSAVLFPFALIVITLGYRAVVHQENERERVENLHDASRVLAGTPELNAALGDFLSSAARAVSSLGATAALEIEGRTECASVYAGEPIDDPQMLRDADIGLLLAHFRKDPRAVMDGTKLPGRLDEFRSSLGARSFLAVPLLERDEVAGALMVVDRVGAADFEEQDARLLESLANDLSLTLGSRRLFEEVAEQRERFQLLVEAVNDYAIFMVDPQGIVVSWNAGAERIQGYPADGIIGEHFSKFYPPEEDPTTWMQELSAASREGRREVEGWRIRSDGSRFLANEIITPIKDPTGALRGFAKVTRDITERVTAEREREQLEVQLQQAQKLESIGQLAGGIAHDFNNILSIISNSSVFVLDELADWDLTAEQRVVVEDVEEIRDAAERAAGLTRQLLIFSRRDVIEPQILDVNYVISNLQKLMARAMGGSVTIDLELDRSVGTVKADPGQLEQVLLNLAINARDAMSGDGTLTIATRERTLEVAEGIAMDVLPGRHVEIRVTDTGAGMTRDVISKAFDPFFTTKEKGRGTGLGLATVYGIVRRSRGRISIDSEPGVGTTFIIQLPVDEDEDEMLQTPAAPSLPRASGETILLVEDEASVRSVTERILSNAGYKVLVAGEGSSALQLIQDWDTEISLVLTDVLMPGMNGIELAERARALRGDLKIVFMSGYTEAMELSKTIGDTIPLLQKPFSREELLAELTRTLND